MTLHNEVQAVAPGTFLSGDGDTLGLLARRLQKGSVNMANKTNRKLGLKKETLRRLTDNDLRRVAGGYTSTLICEAANESGRCGSTTLLRMVSWNRLGEPEYIQISG